jgi:hypothetical protein
LSSPFAATNTKIKPKTEEMKKRITTKAITAKTPA